MPSRVILHGVEGVGKSSFSAFAPKPIFLMAHGETGLETLIDGGQVPETPHLPELMEWSEALSAIDWLRNSEHDFRTLAIDTLNGIERLCHELICEREYGGEWGKQGFTSYMQGFEVSLGEWRRLLNALDRLRKERHMSIICLCHSRVITFKNPAGADYDRYTPAMHSKTWELTHRWADHVLFANFFVEVVSTDSKKPGKGKGGQDRVIYTQRHAAYDAKNRAGLPEEISMGSSGAEAWHNFISALKAARKGGE